MDPLSHKTHYDLHKHLALPAQVLFEHLRKTYNFSDELRKSGENKALPPLPEYLMAEAVASLTYKEAVKRVEQASEDEPENLKKIAEEAYRIGMTARQELGTWNSVVEAYIKAALDGDLTAFTQMSFQSSNGASLIAAGREQAASSKSRY